MVRTVPVVFRARRARETELVSRLTRRVSLRELDINWHMNQARYAQVMELGRVDWYLRSGSEAQLRRHGVKMVVAEQRIVYRRELKLGTTYVIDTRALGVEGRLLNLQSALLVGERVHALNDTKMIFIGADGVLKPARAEEVCEGLSTAPLMIDDWRVVARA